MASLEKNLLQACREGNFNLARQLIRQGCNPKSVREKNNGSTPLHYACEKGNLGFVKTLVETYSCDPQCKSERHGTPLHLACGMGRLHIVRYLITEQNCNPHHADTLGHTPLHLACRSGRLDVVKYLITEQNCNPHRTDMLGHTPLHEACRIGRLNIVKYLTTEQNCNPQCTDKDGETPLHEACRIGRLNIVRYLITEQNCNPQCADDVGRTPLHLACRIGRLNIVKYLTTEQNCNPQCTDKDGETPLHEACRIGRLNIVKYLVTEGNCNPQCTDKYRQTPLHKACREGRLDIVKYLITEQNCNPQCTDEYGQTPLHKACWMKQKDVVRYLLREVHCDPNHGVKITILSILAGEYPPGTPPLGMTTDPGVIRELIECGANPEKIMGKLPQNCPKQPTELAVKVFVVGEKGAGKSTLTKALSLQKGVWAIMNWFTIVTGVNANTAGIIPHDIQSERFGHTILYDFAGHKEFYASHCAMLRNATVVSTAAIILLVVDLRESDEKIIRSIQSWLHLISTACHMHVSSSSKSHVIVVGSCADDPKSKENILRKRNNITALFPMPDVNFVGFVAVDCRYATSFSMSELCQHLLESCRTVRNQAKTNFSCHFFLYLLQMYHGSPAVSVRTIVTDLQKPQSETLTKYVPEILNLPQVQTFCEEMNERGNILLLRNEALFEESWVVLNQGALLSRVTGTVFAPEDSGFKVYREVANTTGVVPFSKLEGTFPDLDPKMLVQFLCHLEFCHEITDPEGLQLLQAARSSTTPNGRWFFFPGLVKIEAPDRVWEADDKLVYQSGWLLQCCQSHQFFTPHFLQVLLIRLAFSFALALEDSHISDDHPALQRKCSVWKNGIYWSNRDGVQCLVEIKDRQVLVMLRCPKGIVHELGCVHLRSLVVRKVLGTLEQLCSNVSTNEIILRPFDVRYPLNQVFQRFNIYEIAATIAKAKPSAVSSTGHNTATLEELLHFEPYAQLSQHILEELFSESNGDRKISDEYLRHIAHRVRNNKDKFIDLFEHLITNHFEQRKQEPPPLPSDLVQVMQVWRDHSEGSYQCLRRELDQFSVFARRNPLELTGYACKETTGASGMDTPPEGKAERPTCLEASNTRQASGDLAAINSDETTPSPVSGDSTAINSDETTPLPVPEDSAAITSDKTTPSPVSGDSTAISSDETAPSPEWSMEKIDGTTLDIRILHDVSVGVVTVVNWRELGLAIGLNRHTLERIAAQYPRDPRRCLTETLAAWLQKEDESTPSWRALVGALRKPTVGKEALADVIGKAHGADDSQSDSSDIPVSYQDVDNTPLDSLYHVIEEVWTVPDWFHLGLALRLSYHTLKIIEADQRQANHRQATRQCLTEMLTAWLDMQGSTVPSWQALVCALSSPIVNKREVANTIATSHQKSN